MRASDDSSFYLYGVGESPEALTLGSLVLEKYWQPLTARHYTHEMLSNEALHEHAHTTNLTNVALHSCSRLSPSVRLKGREIVNLNLAWTKDLERIVVAEKGTKIILKDPENFLTTAVLSNPDAQKSLKDWLSAAYSAYVMNMKFARRPKVWLLTGLYLLEKTRTTVSRGHFTDISAGISSSIVGALPGVSVGGSMSLGTGSSWEVAMEVPDPHVWAAQFRLLNARFIKMGEGGLDEVKLPTSLGLYHDVLSQNIVRGGERESDYVELGLENRGLDQEFEKSLAEGQDDQEAEEYEKQLERAIKVFEIAPKHHLQ